MPPRTRTRATKFLKENIDVTKKSRVKPDGKITKPPRKALADKTNSLSDDNASIDIPIKTSKKTLNSKTTVPNGDDKVRPRRERRLPPRFIENQTLKSQSNIKDSLVKQSSVTSKTRTQQAKQPPLKKLPIKTAQNVKIMTTQETNSVSPLNHKPKDKKAITMPDTSAKTVDKQVVQSAEENRSNGSSNESSPFKTPSKDADNSFIANRPKRVCRLPSKFHDHSISPSKFIPVQPCHASTPLLQKTAKCISKNPQNVPTKMEIDSKAKNGVVNKPMSQAPKQAINKASTSSSSIDKSSPDTNNNGKNYKTQPKRATAKTKSQRIQVSPDNNNKPLAKRLLDKSLSFRVLEDKKSGEKNLDVYEFTFDPNDEPPPKKKRRKPVKKRPAKPKTTVLKSNYDDNVSKALTNLKNRVKPSQMKPIQSNDIPIEKLTKPLENPVKPTESATLSAADKVQSTQYIAKPSDNIPQSNYSANIMPNVPVINESSNSIHPLNYESIRVEDIAADFEFSGHQNDINYSPVNSPYRDPVSDHHETIPKEHNKTTDPVNIIDPLNLQEDGSFFKNPPIASSSMNVSVRHPLASPWRVEFGSLPMTWHNNTYLKPNMTPAVESSFINSEVTKKKHVYTNMVPEHEPLPEIFEDAAPALKQTSIISYIKEIAERNANKKKRMRSQILTSGMHEECTSNNSPKKAKTTKETTPNTSKTTNETSKDKENSSNTSNKTLSPEKKKKDKDCTYFGFDDSENVENVSPVKVNLNTKTRHLRSRNVLQELNSQPVPTRAVMPMSGKTKLTSSEVVAQLYDQLKTAEDAQFPVKETAKEPTDNTVPTNIDDPWHEDSDDSQSVHLFEDIEVVHHLKPHRKSYGKAKKVTFQQSVDSNDSDSQLPPTGRPDPESSDDDDLADLSFHLPNVKQPTKRTKKKKPKKQLTKKEEKEVEEWAADFNSMCEDVDEFPLLVE